MTFWDDYYLNGTGFNFKIGAIYKPVQTVRLGLAFHSPTFYEIDEESTLEMQSSEQQGAVGAGTNYYNYEFNTPLKVVASGAIVFAKRGLLSADVEYMDYGTQRFRRGGNGSDNFNDLNSVMSDVFGSAINLRLGAEFKLSNEFAIRGGYEMYGNPFDGTLDAQSTLSDNV